MAGLSSRIFQKLLSKSNGIAEASRILFKLRKTTLNFLSIEGRVLDDDLKILGKRRKNVSGYWQQGKKIHEYNRIAHLASERKFLEFLMKLLYLKDRKNEKL